MTQSSNKFEALLELLINEENDKAEQMFHEIVVEKSRDIYENLASSETTEESVEEAPIVLKTFASLGLHETSSLSSESHVSQ